jgi:hypothetical protein
LQIDPLLYELDASGFQLRDIEKVADQVHQAPPAFDDPADPCRKMAVFHPFEHAIVMLAEGGDPGDAYRRV